MLRKTLRLAAAGLGVGLIGSLAASRLIASGLSLLNLYYCRASP